MLAKTKCRFNVLQQACKYSYKFITIEMTKNQITNISDLVAILELTAHKTGIKTISEMARSENKSPNGINQSKKYRKLNIGGQKMCVKGLNDLNLPF